MRTERARSLIEYLDRRLGDHTGRGPEYQFYCPACLDRIGTESSHRKLAVNLDKRKGQCWRCEFRFARMETLFKYLNKGRLTVEERILLRREPPLVTDLRQSVREALSEEPSTSRAKLRPHSLPRNARQLAPEYGDTLPGRRALRYLRSRGFGLDDALRLDTHFCPAGKYAGYLIFPVYQFDQLVFWASRYAGEHRLKSRNPEVEKGWYGKESCLLNYDAVVGSSLVALVEGPLDCMAYEDPPAIGMLGKNLSDTQADLIERLVSVGLEEIVISVDADARRDLPKLYDKLEGRVPVVSVCAFDEGDPAGRRAELDALLQAREPVTFENLVRWQLV